MRVKIIQLLHIHHYYAYIILKLKAASRCTSNKLLCSCYGQVNDFLFQLFVTFVMCGRPALCGALNNNHIITIIFGPK